MIKTIWFLLACAWIPQTTILAGQGVVVTGVRPDTTAWRSGVRRGDVFTHWERLAHPPSNPRAASGVLEDPFHWDQLMIKHAPRGEIRLQGIRDGQPLVLKVPIGLWRMKVRPVFPEDREAVFLEGAALLGKGDLDGALSVWKDLVQQCDAARGAWLHTHMADKLNDAQKLEQAEALYRTALTLPHKAPTNKALVYSKLGRMFTQHSQFPKALLAFEAALKIWEDHEPDGLGSASVHYLIGGARQDQEILDLANKHLSKSLEIRKRLAPHCLEIGHTLNSLSLVTELLSDYETARSQLLQAIEIQERLAPDSMGVAMFKTNLGALAHRRSQYDEAETYYRSALELLKKVAPQGPFTAVAHNNLGNLLVARGYYDEAEKNLRASLRLMTQIAPESINASNFMLNLGSLLMERGHFEKAEAYLRDALQIVKKRVPNTRQLCITLRTMANLAILQSDYKAARVYLEEAAQIARTQYPGSMEEAVVETFLGITAQEQGENARAEPHFTKALEILDKFPEKGTYQAGALNRLGRIALDGGDLEKAEFFFKQALDLHTSLAPESLAITSSLDSLGLTASERGNHEEARSWFVRSYNIRKKLAPESLETAVSLNHLGTVHAAMNLNDQAILYYKQAVDFLESQVGRLGGSKELEADFRARHEKFYTDCLSLMLEEGKYEEAFHTLERFRARTFLEMLAERDIAFNTEDAPPQLVEERRRLGFLYERSQRDLWRLDPDKETEAAQVLYKKMEQYRREYYQVSSRIREASPRLSSMLYPKALDFKKARAKLDQGTLMLSYWTSPQKTWLFMVRPNQPLQVAAIPKGEAWIGDQVRDLLSLLATPPGNEPMARRILDMTVAGLFEQLIGPATAPMAHAEQLVIVGHGPLLTLPFHLLRGPLQPGGPEKYLIEHIPVSHVVSGTVYAGLKEKRREQNHPVQLVAFGNPKYPWTSGGDSFRRFTQRSALRSILKVDELKPLPYTAKEVKSIASLYGPSARVFLGEEATEAQAKALDRRTRIVHFAGHGFYNKKTPLDSALLLTIPESYKDGDENGVLQAWEIIESMRLDADLVVLSACETGLGEALGGEGLIGLTRAFQYAGASSVLASLWAVSDAASSELMKQFYAELKQGHTRDQALRRAQQTLIREPITVDTEQGSLTVDFSHPYYWAAFQLMGYPN